MNGSYSGNRTSGIPPMALRVSLDPDMSEWLYAIINGLPEDAARSARRMILRYPDEATPRRMLGEALWRHGAPEEAIEAYKEAVALAPSYGILHLRLGDALIEVGRHAEAVMSLLTAQHLMPGDEEATASLEDALKGAERQNIKDQ